MQTACLLVFVFVLEMFGFGLGSWLSPCLKSIENYEKEVFDMEKRQQYNIIRKIIIKEDEHMDVEKMKADLGPGAVFDIGEENTAFAQYFTGECYLKMLTTEGVPTANVTFARRTINNWHIHHKGGQILLVTGGRGWYQEWGKEAQELHPGDVVNIPPEVKHWHGAAKDSWFQHIAIEVPAEGGSNEWLEPVDEEEYNKLK